MRVSDIISKKVYSIDEGLEIGYVLNISLSERVEKIQYLQVASLFEEKELMLNYKDVNAISEEAVFVKNSKQLFFDANLRMNNPIGKKIFSINGKSLGVVNDVEIEKDIVKKIIGSSCEVLPKYIYSCGEDCLFFSKNRLKNQKKQEKNAKNNEINVKIQKVSLPYEEKIKGTKLIGKSIFKDILDKNCVVVFRKNTKVTPAVLVEAKQKGVLKILEENLI